MSTLVSTHSAVSTTTASSIASGGRGRTWTRTGISTSREPRPLPCDQEVFKGCQLLKQGKQISNLFMQESSFFFSSWYWSYNTLKEFGIWGWNHSAGTRAMCEVIWNHISTTEWNSTIKCDLRQLSRQTQYIRVCLWLGILLFCYYYSNCFSLAK